MTDTREAQLRVGTDVPSVREETSYCLSVLQQLKVVGCCPGVHALNITRCHIICPIDLLAVEVASIKTAVQERRDGRWCKSRGWRFVDVN